MLNRRDFVVQGAAGIAGLAAVARSGFGAKPASIIDCHVHFYDPTRPRGVPWPAKSDPLLYRRVLPEDFQKIASPLGVTGTVVVEASPLVEDNDWILDLAVKDRVIVGLVGNLLPGGQGCADHLRRLAKNPLFRGIRLRSDGGGPGQVARGLQDKLFVNDLKLMAELDLSLDLGAWSASPADVAAVAGQIPNLRIVINHIAGVKVDGKAPPADWVAELRKAAGQPNVFVKISALVESTGHRDGHAPTDPGYYKPTIDAFWETFGQERLIYGSNWPVCEYGGTYETVFNIVKSYFADKGPVASQKYFSANAAKAYKWVNRAL